jgi:5-methylcytosine-specific restriction endonuclease McrA
MPLAMETPPRALGAALPLAAAAASLTNSPSTVTPPSYPLARPTHRQVEPLSQDRFAVRFTADAEFLTLLEEVRGLNGHRDPSGDLLTLLKAGLEARQRELLKQRFAVGRKPRRRRDPLESATDPSNAGDSTREGSRPHIPTEVAREVYERDGGQCTFVSATGRRCAARRQLELDHIVPWVVSRDDSSRNLRLPCRAHNQLQARRYFGRGYMSAVMKGVRARRAGSEPD